MKWRDCSVPTRMSAVLLVLSIAACGVVSFHAVARSQEAPAHHAAPAHDAGFTLPEDLRDILREEMQEVETNASALVSALARADWKRVERLAVNIGGSYILERKLNEAQKHALQKILPAPFKEADARFHQTAHKLAKAARSRDAELAGFYFYRMTQSCTECHAHYATERFPDFAAAKEHVHGK